MNKNIMKAMGFGENVSRVERGLCATCGERPSGFRDAISRKEFGISGMCQKCQDSVFGISDDEMEDMSCPFGGE